MRRREESAVKIWLANVRLSTWLGSVVASGAFRAATEGGSEAAIERLRAALTEPRSKP